MRQPAWFRNRGPTKNKMKKRKKKGKKKKKKRNRGRLKLRISVRSKLKIPFQVSNQQLAFGKKPKSKTHLFHISLRLDRVEAEFQRVPYTVYESPKYYIKEKFFKLVIMVHI